MPKTHDYLIRSTPVASGDNSLPEKKPAEKKSRLQSTPAAKTPRSTTSLPHSKPTADSMKKSPASATADTAKKERIVIGPDGKPVRIVEMHFDFSKISKNIILFLLLFIFVFPFLLSLFGAGVKEVTLSDFVRDLAAGKIDKISVAGNQLRLNYQTDNSAPLETTKYIVYKESNQTALDLVKAAGVDLAAINLEIKDISWGQLISELFFSFLPIILMAGFFLFIFRQGKSGIGMDIFGMGKSKAKIFVKGKQSVRFADVGGMPEAKKELEEIVDFLKNPRKYQKVGARTPKGVLLVGPAGTGKTLLARAVAGEAGVQFLSIAGSEFMEMLVGVGASRVRDLFDTAKKTSPSIIFIDEIDAIGRMRSGGGINSHDEREQTLNQILVEMDGFSQHDNVIVIAATNRADMLDPALVRPGRFDRRVFVNLPDLDERRFIINIHKKGKPFVSDLDWEQVAKMTTGFSGADLENMLNEAAINIVRDNREAITLADLSDSALKVKLGPSKKRLTDEYERKMTAYHEAGHALVSHLLPFADEVSRISIISRGAALGYTITPPNRDKMQTTKNELLDEMSVLLGGRAAEELVFGEMTVGASSDISRATKIARKMVEEWGMSSLGPIFLAPQYEDSDYARIYDEPRTISAQLKSQVDVQVQTLVNTAFQKTTTLLKKHRSLLDKISLVLLEKETLEGEEFTALVGIKKVTRPS